MVEHHSNNIRPWSIYLPLPKNKNLKLTSNYQNILKRVYNKKTISGEPLTQLSLTLLNSRRKFYYEHYINI